MDSPPLRRSRPTSGNREAIVKTEEKCRKISIKGFSHLLQVYSENGV